MKKNQWKLSGAHVPRYLSTLRPYMASANRHCLCKSFRLMESESYQYVLSYDQNQLLQG